VSQPVPSHFDYDDDLDDTPPDDTHHEHQWELRHDK